MALLQDAGINDVEGVQELFKETVPTISLNSQFIGYYYKTVSPEAQLFMSFNFILVLKLAEIIVCEHEFYICFLERCFVFF